MSLFSPISTLFPYTTLFRSSSEEFQKALLELWDIYKLKSNGHPEECIALATLAWVGCMVGGGNAAICGEIDRKSTRLNSSHLVISYAVFCLKKKKNRL